MMLVLGRCLLLVVTIDVSDACNDCSVAAVVVDVGEGDLTLLLDVSSPPFPSPPPRCDDDGRLSLLLLLLLEQDVCHDVGCCSVNLTR